ncbi:MAG: protease modulator HflC, partial [Leptospiraceae bacterium]|nr:protease modulator HflC [Leptospiraceae bacterium]
VIITQFGEPQGGAITEPGIHFKVPFLQDARKFDKRFLEWDGDRNEVPTRDKRFIWVDAYARWRISEPLLFLERVQNEMTAQSRLDDILDGETRNAIARHDLVELIRSTNREFQVSDELDAGEESETFVEIKTGRDGIHKEILQAAAPKLDSLGIELLDIRFKRIKYVEAVQQTIFDRMIAERKRIADKFRSEGQGEASKILGDKERDLKQIESEATKEAQQIRGEADAKAAAIYAAAYDRNAQTRDFYRFLKTME